MQNVPIDLWDIWEAGDFTGENKPYARITIQKSMLSPAHTMKTMLNQAEPQVEIPFAVLKTLSIDRRLGADAAQMTLVMKNQLPIDPLENLDLTDGGFAGFQDGRSLRDLGNLGRPGYFTFRRGVNATNQIGWGYLMSPQWVDMLIPNRTIRTWQGYGTDGAALPWEDTRQVLTGTWLIDRVEFNAMGDITITCRDYLKLAIEQRLYPPVIPLQNYPLEFCADHFVDVAVTVDPNDPTSVNVGFHQFNDYDSSVGYQTNVWNDSVYGHRAAHVFDGDWTTYWLSLGHSTPGGFGSFEWIAADTNGNPINFVQFRPKIGNYQVYICVMVGGIWQGSATVPYQVSQGETNTGAAMAYVKGPVNVPATEEWFGITLPDRYNAEQVRVVFTNLQPVVADGTYRASIYGLEVFDHPFFEGEGDPETTVTHEFVEGNIDDYVDLIKILAGWAGFYWLEGTPADPVLAQFGTPEGRIWGDFFNSGAYPVEPPCIPASFWDNKSVMDGINQIKEILGYIVYADATGGIICRMPNIWRTGNYVLGQGFVGADSVHVLNEKTTVLDLGVILDDASLRSEIIVVSSTDPTLHTAFKPTWSSDLAIPGTTGPQGDAGLLGGQDRIVLVPNYPFVAQAEVDKFAYLIGLWIHWSFRKDKVRIPGMPAFMPDDQVLIYERVTHEQFVHYIEGVNSVMDFSSGTWFMDMDTHWLGEGPDRVWVVNTYEDMPPALYAYLLAVGEIETGVGNPPAIFELPEFANTDVWDRVNDDFASLFPGAPTVNVTDYSLSDADLAALYGSIYVVNPSGVNGGTVANRSQAFYQATWGAPGSGSQTSMAFMYPWNVLYDITPQPPNTSSAQLKGVTVTCHSAIVNAYRLMATIFAEHSYYVRPEQTASFNYRVIAGTNVLSVHSWGLAIDINWNLNYVNAPSGSVSSAFKAACEEICNTIRTVNGKQVFEWGGHWNSKKDWMHLEVVCTRADILTGVTR